MLPAFPRAIGERQSLVLGLPLLPSQMVLRRGQSVWSQWDVEAAACHPRGLYSANIMVAKEMIENGEGGDG